MRKTDHHYVEEVIGVVLIVIGLLLTISLLSYHIEDRSFSTVSSHTSVHNAVGKVGAISSDLLFQLFGVGAYLIPAFLLFLGWRYFRPGAHALPRRVPAGTALLVLALSAFAEFEWRGENGGFAPNWKGGMIGHLLSHFLYDNFGSAGSQILLFSLFLSGWMMITLFSPRSGIHSLIDWSRKMEVWGRAQLLIRQSQKKRRTKIKREKEEEPTIVQTPAMESSSPQIVPLPEQEVFTFARKEDIGDYRLPPLSLLSDPSPTSKRMTEEEWVAQSLILERKLLDFDVQGRVTQVSPGPVVTMFEFEPAPGVKLNRITNLSDDLALVMKATQVRIVAPLPGKSTVGIEIPNVVREEVLLKEILASPVFNQANSRLPFSLGKDIFGNPIAADLAAMPHLLVAGSTGSGKSVGLNTMILSLLYSAAPSEVKILMIDPKMLEFSLYDGIPHLITPVIVRAKAASDALKKMVAEMQRRYQLLAEKGVRNIDAYNKLLRSEPQKKPAPAAEGAPPPREHVPLPYIVIFIDELADLMMVAARDVEDSITRLAQMARASGIHLVLATQRPSVDVLTGVIKANFPARIAFCVSSKTDSRTILDANGAEQLLGKGDMLYSSGTGKITRIHGSYVSEEEIKKVVSFIKEQAEPHYESLFSADESAAPEGGSLDARDDLYEQARELVISTGQASASFLQRRMRVGYPRAARMIELMEEDGLIGPASGGKPREILVRKEEEPRH